MLGTVIAAPIFSADYQTGLSSCAIFGDTAYRISYATCTSAAAIAGTASVKHTAREATNATIFLQETVCVQYFATHSSPLLGYAVC
jgi:hypothetical protein